MKSRRSHICSLAKNRGACNPGTSKVDVRAQRELIREEYTLASLV
jgi:hypothetical protein